MIKHLYFLVCLVFLVSFISAETPSIVITLQNESQLMNQGYNSSGNILPTQNSIWNIGSDLFKWLNGYFVNLFADKVETTNLNVSNKGNINQVATNYVDFNSSYVEVGHTEGRLHWNSNDGTLEVDMPYGSVHLQIGQETLVKAKESSGQDIKNGDVVYITGASGHTPEITKADADTYLQSLVLGVATEDFDHSFNFVTITGVVRGINTSGISAGSMIWLSQETGKFTNVRPSAPAMSVFLGYCLYEHATEGVIVIRPTLIPRMQGLSDTYGTPNITGQFYVWNNLTSRFELTQSPTFINLNITNQTTLNNTLINGNLILNNTVWDDVYISLETAKFAGTNDPDFNVFLGNTRAVEFQNNILASQDEAFFTFQMPHAYKLNSSFEAHLHWSPDSNNAGDANFSLECTFGNISTVFPTPITYNANLSATANTINKHYMTDFNGNYSCSTVSCIGQCRIMRESASSGDTYNSGIFVHANRLPCRERHIRE